MSSQTELEKAPPQYHISLTIFQRQLDTKLIRPRDGHLSPSPLTDNLLRAEHSDPKKGLEDDQDWALCCLFFFFFF